MAYKIKSSKKKESLKYNIPKKEKPKDIELPYEQAVYVPSTNKYQKEVSKKEMNNRTEEVEKYFSKKYGGYTAVKTEGGYVMKENNKLVKEDVVKVTSFSSKKDYNKEHFETKKKIRKWGKKWGQESMGYEHEGDLTYVQSS